MSGAAPVCLVTGATGFIGSHLVARLVREGFAVRALVRRPVAVPGAETVRGDLADAGSLAAAVAGCRYVFHCGALVSDWATVPEITRVNVGGTRDLLAASAAAGVERFVHFSSTDVYGYPGGCVDERFRSTRFRNWYAESKRLAEDEVFRRGPEAVVLRPATVYGPGSVDVVGELARALRGGYMLLVARGRADAGLCYVENLVDAALLALRAASARGEAFNVSDGLDVTWRRFTDDLASGLGCGRARFSIPYAPAVGLGSGLEHGYRALRRVTGVSLPPLLSRQAVHVMGVDQSFSAAKARSLLGWEPRVGYAAGLEATLAWLRVAGSRP